MTFSQRLDSLCKEAGTTATRLGIDLGFSKSAGSLWKNSTGLPRNSTLKKIADYFDMTVDELLENVDTPVDYDSIDTSAFNQQVWQTFLTQNNYNEHKAIDAYLRFEKAQMQDAMNANVINDNHGVIGNTNAPVHITNSENTPLTEQEAELLNLFRKMSVLKQAQLLVKAAEMLDADGAKI